MNSQRNNQIIENQKMSGEAETGQMRTDTRNAQTQTWKEILVEYSEEATMHGVGHVFKAKTSVIRRGFWFLALGVAFCVCWMMVIQQILLYFSYPINTVETTVEVDTLYFPTVTICNYNRYMKSLLQANPGLEAIFNSPQPGTSLNWSDPLLAPYADLDMRELMLQAAHPMNLTFLQCAWKSEEKNCSDIFEKTTSEFDVCFTFNSRRFIEENQPFTVNRRGAIYGLTVELNAKQEEYYDDEGSAAGFRVAVHGYNNMPLVEELGVPVSPGTETHLAVTQRYMKRLPRPYEGDDCVDTEGDFTNPLKYFPFYTYDGCRKECEYAYMHTSCGCVPFLVTADTVDERQCTLRESLNCSLVKQEEYYARNLSSECHCKLPCTEMQFDVSQSFALFPSDYVIGTMEANYNLSAIYLRSNVVRLSVYYKSMNYQLVEQRAAYTRSSAIGDIGGQMGLCLGASVLTIMELGDLFVKFLLMFIQSGKVRQK